MGLASQRLEESPGSPGLREEVGGQVSCWMGAGVGGVPAERMWLKLQVEERRDFTQEKTIRTERGRGGERRGEAGLPSKEKVPERDQPKGGCKQKRETETDRDKARQTQRERVRGGGRQRLQRKRWQTQGNGHRAAGHTSEPDFGMRILGLRPGSGPRSVPASGCLPLPPSRLEP